MVILGIDPGLANTGWAIVETRGDVCRARAYGCITTEAGVPLNERLGRIYRELSIIVERYHPSDLAVEEVFFSKNVRSAIPTAHARGAALTAASMLGLTVGEYTPMQLKQAIVGTGSADKHQVTYMVRQVLALDHDPKPDHAADALAAAVCHANMVRTIEVARIAQGS
ncbi:MAG: crossover junction endodeoxyribonuclease RuvC [Atopobiaceae bacterium]|nr:crossover junction endodeoxyribonuclease RuvC [Atopobiaceae bacterium]